MSTNTWQLDSPMLPPLVLRPPHGPRLVRLVVMLVAVVFYLCPAGWSLVTNGPEGELAGAGTELLRDGGWRARGEVALLHGPLVLWLERGSLGFCGGDEFAARLPAVLGVLALFWVVLRLGERLGTLWRGCVAVLVLLCCPGMFTLGRLLSPVPVAAAFIAAAIYSLQRSVPERSRRRRWLLLAWLAWSGATLSGGWRMGAVPVGTVLVLAVFYPEARLRFKGLFSWEGGVVFGVTAVVMGVTGFVPWREGAALDLTMGRWGLFWSQWGLLFPWLVLLLPALGALGLRLFRMRRPAWEEALPLAWLVSALALTAWVPSLFFAFLCWPAFALWAAAPLNTLRRTPFLYGCAGIAVLAAVGFYVTQHLRVLLPLVFPAKAGVLGALPQFFWAAVTPLASMALLAFVLLAGAAFFSEYFQNRRFALLALFAAMIPAGFALADIGAKFAPYFSDAPLTGCVEAGGPRAIYVEASRYETSSLRFYLSGDSRRQLRPVPPDLAASWRAPAVLITSRERLEGWRRALGGRFNLGCEAGEHVALFASP